MSPFKSLSRPLILATSALALVACATPYQQAGQQPGQQPGQQAGHSNGTTLTGPILTAPQIDPQTRTAQGAVVGALIGGIAGATRGDDANDRRQNAAVGALAGAVAGGAAGNLLDRQAQQLSQDLAGTGVTVTQNANSITLNLPGDITFASNSASIEPRFQRNIDSIATTLAQYPDTRVQITGHTDNTGGFQLNQQLSQARAGAVAQQLQARGIQYGRISTVGASYTQPIADNQTESGRRMNRRVDLVITPAT